MQQALVLPSRRDLLPESPFTEDFARCRELLHKVKAYKRELKEYLEEHDELIGYNEVDNRSHVKFLFRELDEGYTLSKELRTWFIEHCPNKSIWFFTSEYFSGHGMTTEISTGWMQERRILAYKYTYTDNASAGNEDGVLEQLEKRGVPRRDELEHALRGDASTLLEDLLLYLHYHLLPKFRSLAMECDEGDFLTEN